MQVFEAIRMKRAVRKFIDRQLSEEDRLTILNAGRRAQSSKNTQPWHFLAIKARPQLEALSSLGTYAGHVAGAAFAVAILTPDPDQNWSIVFDVGQAAAYMQLAAWERGIGSCLATIYDHNKAKDVLGLPEDIHIRIAISFGYPLKPGDMTAAPRRDGRKELREITHYEVW